MEGQTCKPWFINMKTDDWVERERKKFIAKQDLLEQAQVGKDNELVLWVMLYGREPVETIMVGIDAVRRVNRLRKAGYITNEWKPDAVEVFQMQYVLTNKAKQRLEHLSKRHNRSIKK